MLLNSLKKQLKMPFKFIDIGANLTDGMFKGIYGGKQKHENDFDLVLSRAWEQSLKKIIITVGTLNEVDAALKIANTDDRLYITVGCHPTRCGEFLTDDPVQYYENLRNKIAENRDEVVAIGECGLDYDRLHFCEKDVQKKYFAQQLNLAAEFQLPLFLHCRNSHDDFMDILIENREKLTAGGVVHSFDGTLEEAQKILKFDVENLYIGLNGCSLKTAANLSVVKELPNDKILLETDCPWCGIRPTHAGYQYVTTFPTVKKKEKWTKDTLIDGRCEPCQIRQVLEVIAGVKQEDAENLANIFYDNTMNLFFKQEL